MLFDASPELTLKNRHYRNAVGLFVWQNYLNDLDRGDATTTLFLPKSKRLITAVITLGESGVFAGRIEAEWFLKKLGIDVVLMRAEGQRYPAGHTLMKLSGTAEAILKAERTLLNLIQRMSGIATFTADLVKRLPSGIHLLSTRKTVWGLLDKRAVAVGGGKTHRLTLSDALLVKDNHLHLWPDWEEPFRRILAAAPRYRFVQMELESEEEAEHFEHFCADLSARDKEKLLVMLDNFTPRMVAVWAPRLAAQGILVEVSGGVTSRNLEEFLLPGVSALSCGALTFGSHALDMSLHFL